MLSLLSGNDVQLPITMSTKTDINSLQKVSQKLVEIKQW